MSASQRKQGTILIVVLLAMTLMTAFIMEFAYGAYVSISAINNWSTSQRAAVLAQSGIPLAASYANRYFFGQGIDYSYRLEKGFPFPEPFEGEEGDIIFYAEDETGKIDINTLVNQQGDPNRDDAHNVDAQMRCLCEVLDIPTSAVDQIIDWIDPNRESQPGVIGSEDDVRNGWLTSLSDLDKIPGFKKEWSDTLRPYLTIYGIDEPGNNLNAKINLNTAEEPVLRCLFEENGLERAEKIIIKRLATPLREETKGPDNIETFLKTDLGLSTKPSWMIAKGNRFRIISTGRIGDISRIVEAVIKVEKGKPFEIKYWREY